MIQKGGINMSVDDFIKRIEGGMPNEEDPNVKAYREAVDTQIKANEQLSKLEELNALKIEESMLSLQGFLAKEFPRILTDAVKQSKEDAETKPETKSEPSKAQKTKAEAEKEKEDAKKKKEELDIKIRDKESQVRKAEDTVGWKQGASMDVKIKKRELAELKAQRDEQAKAETAATEKSKQADTTIAEEKKAKDKAKAAQAAEEKKAKEAKVDSTLNQSQQTRAEITPTSIPAPPAPGSVQARIEQDQAENRAKIKAKEEEIKTNTKSQVQQTTQPMAQAQEVTKPQVQANNQVEKASPAKQQVFSTPREQMLAANRQRYLSDKKAKRQAYLSKLSPERREKMMTKEEKAERDSQVAKAEEAKKKAETQAQEQQATAMPIEQTKPLSGDAYSNLTPEQKSSLRELGESQKQKRAELEQKEKEGTLTHQEENWLRTDREGQRIEAKFKNRYGSTDVRDIPTQGPNSSMSTGFAAPLTLDDINKPHLPPSQPVPSNLPKPVEYNRQVQAAETGATSQAGAKPTETSAQLLSLDPTSLEGLNAFNTNFGTYVDKLVNFQFPTIPEKIEMVGNHVVDVRVSGAAAFDSLQKGMKELINKSIDEKMSEIWKQTGGALGLRPGAGKLLNPIRGRDRSLS